MKKTNLILCLLCLFVTGLLAGCGSGGGDAAGDITGGTSIYSGVVVDPYIVGAVFEEIGADGRQKQAASSPSDSLGRFRFTNDIQEGSTIRIKSSSRGMHGNSPYGGILKRSVETNESGNLVVSPLTTLIANGMSEDEVVSMLHSAGVRNLTAADLSTDPMQGLVGATSSVTDAKLSLLQANMAVNTLMLATQNYSYAGGQSPVNISDCVALSKELINATDFASLSSAVATSLGGSFTFDDMAKAAVEVQRIVAAQVKQKLATGDSSISSSEFIQLSNSAVENMSTMAMEIAATRIGSNGTGGQSVNAAAIFTNFCSDCHNLGSSNDYRNLSGDGALVSGKFSSTTHNGEGLNTDEIAAMADYLNGTTPVEPPPAAVTGSELYAQECQGCHGSLETTDISNRTASGITTAITGNVGGMGGLALNSDQITLIANALPTASQPPPATQDRTGVEVYDQDCAVCHMLGNYDTTGNGIDLAGQGSLIITKVQNGHQDPNPPNANELAALADYADAFGATQPPVINRTAETLYNDICSTCHFLTGYDEAGSIDLAGKGSLVVTKVAGGHGGTVTTEELTGLATWLDSFSPPAPPTVARDGATVYDQNCAVCHELYGYDAVGNGIDLASTGSTALTKLSTGHGGTVSIEEQQNIATWLDTWSPAPPPAVDRNGETVYNENCTVCHKLYGYDTAGNVDLASQGSLIVSKLGSGHGGTVTAGEVLNIADWVDTFSPAPPPVVARDGQSVYDDECLGCHKVNGYDDTGSAPDIAGNGDGATTRINSGHNGVIILPEELSNVAAWLDTFQPGDPYTGSCNTCHGQPPTTGAHEVHTSLADVGTDCAVCHTNAGHNDTVDLAFQSTWDAKSGIASSNGSTCSSVKCHGGGTTPDWYSGSLNTDTQCSSCHSRGTTEYNSYNSGEHRRHVSSEGYSCDTCHDPAKLANGHFGNLSTVSFEQAPSTTIKSSLSYSNGRCSTPRCHGGETW